MKIISAIILMVFGSLVHSQAPSNGFPMDSIGCLIGKTKMEIYKTYGKPLWMMKGLPPLYEFGTSEITEEKIINHRWHMFSYKTHCVDMWIHFRRGKCYKITFEDID